MARIARRISLLRVFRVALIAACCQLPALLISCTTNLNRNVSNNPPIIRVRLLENLNQVTIAASEPPAYSTGSDPTPRVLGLPKNTPVTVSWAPDGWHVGATTLGTGELTIRPAAEGTVTVNKLPYRGSYRFVPLPSGRFDVINDVDVDGYVAGVLPKELLATWHDATYKAQAIVARTYVLHEKATIGAARYWDVYPDTRSQMYGGIAGETDKSRRAVNETMGIVVTYSAHGETPHLFKAYFSSCCGGITQSAAEAFGEPFTEPLSDQNNHAICNASPKFNWGPVVIRKEELTRRFRIWGEKKQRPEKGMAMIVDVAIQGTNQWGRPTRFQVTDAKQNHYSLGAEEFRNACNSGVGELMDKNAPPVILYSSFVRVISDVNEIRFVEGHGWGHGVGLCQWCAERRAEQGMRAEDIVIAAYQRSKLARAY